MTCSENPIRLETMGNLYFRDFKKVDLSTQQLSQLPGFFGWEVSVKIDASQRFHANLCLVIDVSGSMQLPAALKDREAILGWFSGKLSGGEVFLMSLLGWESFIYHIYIYIIYYIYIICVSYILRSTPRHPGFQWQMKV